MPGENGGWNSGRGGNGGNGGYRNGRQTEAAPSTPRPKVLRLSINETEDIEQDRARLSDLVNALRGFPGSDIVRLTVNTAGGDRADLALAPVTASEPLRQVLVRILGPHGAATIESL